MRKLNVTIIVPAFHDWARLNKCLEALDNQSYEKKDFEIIVVNNDPDDLVPSEYKLPENCIIINEFKKGSYAARNAALRKCRGELIGFTDSDCIPERDWVKKAVNFFIQNNELSRLGGEIKIFFKDKKPTWVELYDKVFAFPQKDYVNSGNAATANMFSYYYIFEKIGFFDENLLSGGDYVWGKKAQENNYLIGYAQEVIVYHPARASLKELRKKALRVGKGQAKFKNFKEENSNGKILEILKIIKPRIYEVKRILKRGKNLNLKDKLILIFLRHYLIWITDFSRMRNKKNNSLNIVVLIDILIC